MQKPTAVHVNESFYYPLNTILPLHNYNFLYIWNVVCFNFSYSSNKMDIRLKIQTTVWLLKFATCPAIYKLYLENNTSLSNVTKMM